MPIKRRGSSPPELHTAMVSWRLLLKPPTFHGNGKQGSALPGCRHSLSTVRALSAYVSMPPASLQQRRLGCTCTGTVYEAENQFDGLSIAAKHERRP
eukprot:9373864-Alexandrium_andersonii.AAC.1